MGEEGEKKKRERKDHGWRSTVKATRFVVWKILKGRTKRRSLYDSQTIRPFVLCNAVLITPHQAQPLRYTLSNPFTARNHRESRLTNKTGREPAKNATSLRTPGPFDMQILAIIIPGNDDSRYVFAAVAWPDSPRPGV